jgi:hypothetical protein
MEVDISLIINTSTDHWKLKGYQEAAIVTAFSP